MKRIIIVLLLIASLFIFGCSPTGSAVTDTSDEEVKVFKINPVEQETKVEIIIIDYVLSRNSAASIAENYLESKLLNDFDLERPYEITLVDAMKGKGNWYLKHKLLVEDKQGNDYEYYYFTEMDVKTGKIKCFAKEGLERTCF